MINGTSMLGKGNPRWPISNVTETTKVPRIGSPVPSSLALPGTGLQQRPAVEAAVAVRSVTASVIAWLGELPRRLGKRLFAMNDAEAGWRGWEITVLAGGLARQYRDPRFGAVSPGAGGPGRRAASHDVPGTADGER